MCAMSSSAFVIHGRMESAWVVTYGNCGSLPSASVFSNHEAAVEMYDYYLDKFDFVNIEKVPVCDSFFVG